jgi:1-acyl-sn-glycerol-3-phosphate acyltransferase
VDRQALASALAVLAQDRALLVAPEGTRRPAMSEAKDGVTFLALRAGAPILPIGLDGTDRFPGDWKRLRRPRVTVRFGPPFRLRSGGGRTDRDTMHQMTREIMYQIAALIPPERRGFYANLDRATTETLEFLA